jgi:lysophospholipid acyltransferase (LPLAT)-like uncharacterized protein
MLSRAWDGFEIPLPFTRVAVVIGETLAADGARNDPATISSAIAACRGRAESLVGARFVPSSPVGLDLVR